MDQSTAANVVAVGNAENTRGMKAGEVVAATIRQQIIRGELKSGDTLPAEAHLIAQYGVSRPTIREAIRILESEDLIAVARGARGGAVVKAPTFSLVARAAGIALQSNGATLGDIYEMRTIIEPAAARMVAERNSEKAVPVLRAQLEKELALVSDHRSASHAIAEFHAIMVDNCESVTMKMFAHSLQHIVEKHMALRQETEVGVDLALIEKRLRYGFRSHAKLIEYIEAKDGDGAEAHWRNHMRAAGVYWLAELAPTTVVELLEA